MTRSSNPREGTGTLEIEVHRTDGLAGEIRAPVVITGTAESPSDFVLDVPEAVIAAGETSGMISLTIGDDDVVDLGKVVTLALPGGKSHVVTIIDDDGVVDPAYPIAGARWNDYVRRASASASDYDQPDVACDGTESTYGDCLHGGERRMVTLGDVSSCAGIAATDMLSAFAWECVVMGGTARVYSSGLATDSRLADLVDSSGWHANDVTITRDGVAIEETRPATWWTNPVQAPPANGAVADSVKSLVAAGTIYVVDATTATAGYNLDADRIAFVVARGATLGYSGRAGYVNSNAGTGENNANDRLTLVSAGTQKFLWIEGRFDASTFPTTTDSRVIGCVGCEASVLRHIALDGGDSGAAGGLDLEYLKRSRIEHVVVERIEGDKDPITELFNDHNRWHDVMINSRGPSQTSHSGWYMHKSLDSVYTHVRIAGTNGPVGMPDYQGRGMFLSNCRDDSFVDVLVAGSSDTGFQLYQSARNTFHQIHTAHNRDDGFAIQETTATTVDQAVIINNRVPSGATGGGLAIYQTSPGNQFSQIVVAHHSDSLSNQEGIALDTLSGDQRFVHNILLGDNTPDCFDGGATNPGFTGNCTGNQGTSMATFRSGVNLATSFVGKVTVDDPVNTSDVAGARTATAISDWTHFTHDLRVWGVDGSTFPSPDQSGVCDSGTCRIWDWRLRASDTVLRDRSGDGASSNEPFLANKPCPAAAAGDFAITDLRTVPRTFLSNASEVLGDRHDGVAVGNDDGLCESGEACVYAPNFGIYQGHGDPMVGGTCVFKAGAVRDVELYAYPNNGD